MAKIETLILPSYAKDFKCIGGSCPDSCCIGWDIDIDKLTYRKYFRTKNQTMKNEFVKHLYKNDECQCDEVDYGRLKINHDKFCPFLDHQKLCKIYKVLGEDHLSNVCYSYPRVYNVLDSQYEISLFMSCPEAIRMLFANKEALRFVEEKRSLEKHIIHSYVNTQVKPWKNSLLSKLKKWRTFSIQTIQNRSLPFGERLLVLGKEFEKNRSKTERDFSTVLKTPNAFVLQLGYFRDLINSLNVLEEIDSPVFVDLTRNTVEGFQLDSDLSLIEISKNYEEVRTNIIDPFMKENSYLFEHYLVNFMFQCNFPFTENQNPFDGYILLIVRFSFIRFYLTGLAVGNGKISKNDVIKVIQSYTKTIDHHKTFAVDLLDGLKSRDFDNMDFAEILLH